MGKVDEFIKELKAKLPDDLAESIGNPKMVWCWKCGRSQSVDASDCFRDGWPLCCGHTMKIDPP